MHKHKQACDMRLCVWLLWSWLLLFSVSFCCHWCANKFRLWIRFCNMAGDGMAWQAIYLKFFFQTKRNEMKSGVKKRKTNKKIWWRMCTRTPATRCFCYPPTNATGFSLFSFRFFFFLFFLRFCCWYFVHVRMFFLYLRVWWSCVCVCTFKMMVV